MTKLIKNLLLAVIKELIDEGLRRQDEKYQRLAEKIQKAVEEEFGE